MRKTGLTAAILALCIGAATPSAFAGQTMAPYCQTAGGGCPTVAFAALGHPCGCVEHGRLHWSHMIRGVVVMRPYGYGLGY
jgi:hypothetical protein